MASSYSTDLKLELMVTGENAGTWGDKTNNNLNVLDAFSAGYLTKSVAGSANVTLTTDNASPTSEASNKVIELTGTLTGDITVFIPAAEGHYIFFNNTSGSHSLTIAAIVVVTVNAPVTVTPAVVVSNFFALLKKMSTPSSLSIVKNVSVPESDRMVMLSP